MGRYVLEFLEIDRSLVAVVGGKGAHLGELSRIEGISVPGGFCVTVDAFSRTLAEDRSIDGQIDRLSSLTLDDQDDIRERSALIRRKIEAVDIPDDLNSAIRGQLRKLGEHTSYAVRSSATAEDMPTASFAGQHDTYLNVVGSDEILRAISRCWASLFTERAVTYRLQNGFDHRKVRMAVVVQQMVAPEVSGILFTADPLTGNRKISSVEAIYGLGEALVSGLVNADFHTVRDGEVVTRSIATKQRVNRPSSAGGTLQEVVEPERQGRPALSDEEVVRIAELGRKIERHFGRPQDIEWCLVDGNFQIVQSRPITTLFPVPETNDSENHVFISVGHQQMMTDPMRPLGLSLFQMTAGRRMHEAGGRLFVDVSQMLASQTRRADFLELMGKSDLLIRDALQKIVDRGDFIPSVPDDGSGQPPAGPPAEPIETDSAIVSALIERNQASIASVKSAIEPKAGLELLDFIEADILELKRILFDPRGHQVFMAAIEATWWLNEHLEAWLGEKNVADTLTLSVPNNITSDMGLALMDVADAIRPYSDVGTYLQHVEDENYLNLMSGFEGGQEARAAIMDFLHTYGMRCVGEIDITRPRWSERPTAILPMILGNIRIFRLGESKRRFSRGLQEAERKEQEVLQQLFNLPDGMAKAAETKQMIDRVRTFIGFREYPKYGMISRYAVYKQALMREAERLVLADVIRESDDIFYLSLEELREAVRTREVDNLLIAMRKEEFRSYEALTPPRVLTSDGEIVTGSYRRETLPADVLLGLPVSAGRVEGRARVILNIEGADLEPGDILVTTFTDPSWTPLFVAIKGLVTEVGGMMTHGAVIAREYGVPAVVGVEHATRLIRDGQRIRVHGTDGYVEFLDERT